MEQATSDVEARSVVAGKKRIPKACSSCRHSKVRCDEQRPICVRCQNLRKECVYFEKPKTIEELRIEELEQQVSALQQTQIQLHSQTPGQLVLATQQHSSEVTSPHSTITLNHTSPSLHHEGSLKRKRSHFHLSKEMVVPNFVAEAMLSDAQAQYYFDCFFEGCDRYVPIFDQSDTFHCVKSRNSLLLNAICAVGCGISGDTSVDSRILHVRLKRWLTTVILSPHAHSLDTVRALMVMACWMPERSMILAIATRIAIDLNLDNAFDDLVGLCFANSDSPECHTLMKRARTWFSLLVLEQILQVDAGNLLDLKLKGVRRCRTLLNQPFSAKLDTRLFSQIELNHLRAKINESLTTSSDDILQAVQDARIDIDVWFRDWQLIMQGSLLSGAELPSLITNLTIQRHWADAMATCRAVRATGVHNIDVMTSEQKEVLVMAKEALQKHLDVMLVQRHYLANFKFAMDFVWAKCAFSFLLLLKLTILLPDDANHDMLQQGRALHEQLSHYSGYSSSKIYLRLLQLSIEKYASKDHAHSAELESFIPDEFIFEWDFPGLNLFSSPDGWDLLFDQYLLGDDLFVGINA